MAGAPPSGPPSNLLGSGARVASRYTIESVIGEGMSGVVYRARRDDDRLFALKIIHRELCADEQIVRRFRREAKILSRLEGPHIVKLEDLLEDDGRLVIVLEHVDAMSLESMMKDAPPTFDQAIEITLQVCAALGAAHAAGVVHRDLKPANVLIERAVASGAGLSIRVVDFGLAKVVHGDMHISGSLTQRDMVFGTPEYMAPEQVRGEDVDARSDIYALGVILHEMVVGEVPLKGKTPLETMALHLSGEVKRPRVGRGGAVVPSGLAAVIARALAKQPGDRYATARSLAEALTAAWGDRLVITPHGVENADALATVDTELNVSTQGLASVDATPGPIVVSAIRGAAARSSPLDVGAPTMRSPSAPGPGRAFWIAAVVIAVICVGVGVWLGVR